VQLVSPTLVKMIGVYWLPAAASVGPSVSCSCGTTHGAPSTGVGAVGTGVAGGAVTGGGVVGAVSGDAVSGTAVVAATDVDGDGGAVVTAAVDGGAAVDPVSASDPQALTTVATTTPAHKAVSRAGVMPRRDGRTGWFACRFTSS
jgi:hypothetical protein